MKNKEKVKIREKEEKIVSKKIRKGDKVLVLSGNERGKTGTVLQVLRTHAIIQGLNVRKKCVKPSEANPKGNIVPLEAPIHISNLRPCIEDGTPVKLKVRSDEHGNRAFYYKIDGQDVLYRTIKK
jgi:large subunit ribosomal protein L24